MKTIHRYVLEIRDEQEVGTHGGAQFLSVAIKPGDTRVSLWALVDTDKPTTTRTVRIVGTGNPLPERRGEPDFWFVGTACVDHGSVVFCWHVFVEVLP